MKGLGKTKQKSLFLVTRPTHFFYQTQNLFYPHKKSKKQTLFWCVCGGEGGLLSLEKKDNWGGGGGSLEMAGMSLLSMYPTHLMKRVGVMSKSNIQVCMECRHLGMHVWIACVKSLNCMVGKRCPLHFNM